MGLKTVKFAEADSRVVGGWRCRWRGHEGAEVSVLEGERSLERKLMAL